MNKEQLMEFLKDVREPLTSAFMVTEKLIEITDIKDGNVELSFYAPNPFYSKKNEVVTLITEALMKNDELESVKVNFALKVISDGIKREGGYSKVKNVIAVASGKGGVGKSTVSVNIAMTLRNAGAKVGLLDADIYGPNIPTMLGAEGSQVQAYEEGPEKDIMLPVEAYGIELMSVGFLAAPDQPLIWRGPMLHSIIGNFTQKVAWGDLDYLIVDLPPGTGDVQLSLTQTSALTGSVIVTLPQKVSLDDARRGIKMFEKMEVPVYGIIENMSYLMTPSGEKMDVFGSGGGLSLADENNLPFLGEIPMEPEVRIGGDNGKPITLEQKDGPVVEAFYSITAYLVNQVYVQSVNNRSQGIQLKL